MGEHTLSPGCNNPYRSAPCSFRVRVFCSLAATELHKTLSPPASPPCVCPGPPPSLYDIIAPVRIVALASQTQFRTKRLQNCGLRLRSELSARGWWVRAGLGWRHGGGLQRMTVGLGSEIKHSIWAPCKALRPFLLFSTFFFYDRPNLSSSPSPCCCILAPGCDVARESGMLGDRIPW